jgi:hypothetical protein
MFVRNHLAVVSHWARDQLRDGAETPERAELLRQLIEAADALRQEPPMLPGNVVAFEQHHRAH